MAGPNPAGFSPTEVLAGLHTAMQFGMPAAQPAIFYMPRTATVGGGAAADEDEVPYNPDVAPTLSPLVTHQVLCAIEHDDVAGETEQLGVIAATTIHVILLDPEYQIVKGFEYVEVGGQRFEYRHTEPAVALGSIDVWSIRCEARDES